MHLNPPVIFIPGDWIGDTMAEALAGQGYEIVRGPAAQEVPPRVDAMALLPLLQRANILVATPGLRVDRALLQALPRLRAVVAPAIGVENIDVAAATELGILVAHGATPENYLGMAEATVMLIAALAMQLPYKQRLLAENAPRPRELLSRSVRGSTIGLVGMGRIARGVVERLRGWEAQLLYFDPYVPQEQAPPGATRVTLDALLRRADFVSLHVTLTAETQGLIGARELGLMKPTAYLVNTSRGAAIDEAALVRALQERRIAGAALDTFAHEPLPADSPLRAFVGSDNVILTPHIIGQGHEVMASLRQAIAENVRRILRGAPALYTKNPEVLARWQERIARLA